MASTFQFALHPADARIVRVHARAGQRMTPELSSQIQNDLGELYRFITGRFGDRPLRLMTILENMALALDEEEQMATHGSLAMAQAFAIERAAYVIDKATARLQFGRLFRENQIADRFKAFATEAEGLAFLTA